MGINILSSEIYNKISAGEVVERPASVVKELVENSIDGGATKIIVEIANGGIAKISVRDNGVGIEPEDVEKAFLPHATSKIAKEEDLSIIASLGFRGEALASIAAISNVEMISKTDNYDFGVCIRISGGNILEKKELGAERGTKVEVNDLFFNTPARLKFLKKPKSEEGEITNLISKLILANPNLSIRYIVDEKIIYNTFGNGLAEALYIIYGKETYDNLLEVNYTSGDISLNGYIARPTYCKPNRTYQTLFVNNRLVTNYMISSAVQDAVDGFIMKGKFPLFALNLTVPYASVDVNVHPSKQEVKFENSNKIYGIVNSAIYKTVSSTNFIQSGENVIKGENENKEVNLESLQKLENKEGFSFSNLIKNTDDEKNNLNLKQDNSTISKIIYEKYLKNTEKIEKNNEILEKNENLLQEVDISSENNYIKNDFKIENKIINYNQNKIEEVFDKFKIVGVIFNTYILIEKDDLFFIIDQHAAHERQLYDKIMLEMNSNEISTQTMLAPFLLHVNNKEKDFILENINSLINFGIDITEFGENTFKISAVPYLLSDINLKNFFDSILKDINSLMKKPIAFINETFTRKACRAAVKGGDKLSENEIAILLDGFVKNNNVLLCPHGRPIVVKFSRTDIEKWFKRIV
ncbi:MAG: DNA mismatch repair endonuclease MutL [Clostridia bacterium]|nr:DNA mismatch repair endonuclease MutL [Clostridia bacterium]